MLEQRAQYIVVERLSSANEWCGPGREQVIPESVVTSAAARFLERELRVGFAPLSAVF